MNDLHATREFGTELSFISGMQVFVEEFLEQAGLTKAGFEIQLAVEEWYVNIVKHGFGDKNEGKVLMRLGFSDDTLEIEVSDNGLEFDPHSLAPPEKPESVEEAKIGGLGVFFIRKLMDETAYRREAGRNVFVMRKRFPGKQEEVSQ